MMKAQANEKERKKDKQTKVEREGGEACFWQHEKQQQQQQKLIEGKEEREPSLKTQQQ